MCVRIILDTNILISAALKPGGLEAWVVNCIIAGHLEVWVTAEVWSEYEEVLTRPKFAAVQAEAGRILEAMGKCAQKTQCHTTATASLDEDDNRFLECAQAAGAAFLVTGNLRHYPSSYGMTLIVNARGFRDALGADFTFPISSK